ncbi:hypothetical protein PG988_016029 [Apiospora saccharicola]
MSSVFRSSAAIRASLRTLTRRSVTPTARVSRRSYASEHGPDHKSSDLPWMIAAGGVTVAGLAYLLPSGAGSKKSEGHSVSRSHGEAKEGEEHHTTTPASTQRKDKSDDGEAESQDTSSEEEKNEDAPKSDKDSSSGGDPKASHGSSQTGSQVPPPSADNKSAAEASGDKKEAHEADKKTMEKRETKVASSSSDMPSKKTAAENPSEDPKKGEGEAVKKSGSAKD